MASADESDHGEQPAMADGRQQQARRRFHVPKLEQPAKFDFSDAGQWQRWSARWRRYRDASGLAQSDEAHQVNTLIYTLREQAEDILLSRAIAEDTHDNVLAAFDTYFGVRRNVIAERAKFNRMSQGSDSMDIYVNKLYRQAEYCDYGNLREQLIRDRLVVGVNDDILSDKLQLEANLQLDAAVTLCRRHEASKQAQAVVRSNGGASGAAVDGVRARQDNKHPRKHKESDTRSNSATTASNSNQPQSKRCHRCGRDSHKKQDCPAMKSLCNNCNIKGHWQAMCRSKTTDKNIGEVLSDDEDNPAFLGEVKKSDNNGNERPWTANISVKLVKGSRYKLCFKLDTGADVTVLCASSYKCDMNSLLSSDRRLVGPGSNPLSVLGMAKVTLTVGNTSVVENVYVVNNQSGNLLSKRACVALGLVQCNTEFVDNVSVMSKFKDEFSGLFTGLGKMNESYTIQLRDDARPVALHVPYDVSQPRLPVVRKQLDDMLSKGVISKVTQPTDWCAGMVQVPKSDDRIRICTDLTNLNKAVRRDTHPSSSVDSSLAKVSGAVMMSKLDANSGYYQIPLSESSRLLTTFITPFGRYCYNRLPFGLVSAGDIFQRCMADILDGLDGVICHMDDLLVFSTVSETEHDKRLRIVLKRLSDAGMTLNYDKCQFSQQSLIFLGHLISTRGVSPDPGRVEDILKLSDPTNKTQLQSLLGSINQLGKFSPRITELTLPIRALLKKDTPWTWDVAQRQAVESIKQELCRAPCLAWYSTERPVVIMCDASNQGLGATMFQIQSDGTRRLVAAKSRSLTETEQRWSPIEKEALGIAWSCSKFEKYILGHSDVTIETDHKPLVPIFNSKAVNDLTVRIQRQRLRAMKYSFKTVHIPGKLNYIADLLSRQPVGKPDKEDIALAKELEICTISDITYLPATEVRLQDLRARQSSDTTCREVTHYLSHGWPAYLSDVDTLIKTYWHTQADFTIVGDLLLYRNRIVIPLSERSTVLGQIHSGHLGISKCRERAKQAVWWPGLSQDIAEMVKSCTICQTHQADHHEPLRPTSLPDRPWQRLASDLFHWKNQDYLLVIDYFSRYVEIQKLASTESKAIINAMKSMFARHGIPEQLMSDNGPQYACGEFKQFAVDYQFTSITSSPHLPSANGEAERAVRTVKSLLDKSADPYKALLAYRNTPIRNGHSPAELLMSRRLRTDLPVDPRTLSPRTVDQQLIVAREHDYKQHMKTDHDRRHNARLQSELSPGDNVHIKDLERTGTVTNLLPGRSYEVESNSRILRRNRRSLALLPNTDNPPVVSTTQTPHHDAVVGRPNPDTNLTHTLPEQTYTVNNPRRSTRVSKPPTRLDL